MTVKIQRYDLNWDEGSQQMERHPAGDYVEFLDHEEALSELQARIDNLQKAVNVAFEALRGEAN